MTYQRVIPRDLFNEANLLKCYGQVYIRLEKSGLPSGWAILDYNEEDIEAHGFIVEQDSSDGSLTITNISLKIGQSQKSYLFKRPLNSRDPYPLYLVTHRAEEIAVFLDNGEFSPEMMNFLRLGLPRPIKGSKPLWFS